MAVIKLEPKGETELEPDGTLDPGPDGEIDPLALNMERDDPIVEQEDLACPLAFLAVESKAEVSGSVLPRLKQICLNLSVYIDVTSIIIIIIPSTIIKLK